MLQPLVGEVNGHPGAVEGSTTTPCRVWVGHLHPANDAAAGSLIFIAAPSIDKTCQAVIREFRAEDKESTILVLCTAELKQKMLALQAGADDCLAVPDGFIDALRLLEIIGARRSRMRGRTAGAHRITANPHTHEVTVDGSTIFITPMEFRLLRELQQHRGEVVTHKHLENLLWVPPMPSHVGP